MRLYRVIYYTLYFDWQYIGIKDIRICGQGMDEVGGKSVKAR